MAISKTTIGTVRFSLRIDKIKKSGLAPIELIYSISGKRRVVNTGLECLPFSWNNQRSIYINKKDAEKLYPDIHYKEFPTKEEVSDLNNELAVWTKTIRDTEILLRAKPENKDSGITSSMVTNAIKEKKEASKGFKKEEPKKYLLDFIKNQIEETKAITNIGSRKVYNTLATHLENFENNVVLKTDKDGEKKLVRISSTKRPKTTLMDADYSFMQSFYNYLIGHVGHLNTTAAKQITGLKTFLNKARRTGYNVNATFQDFAIKRDKLEVIALTPDEFDKIKNMDLSNSPKLDRVRDVFIFGCVTGLRYSDLENLKRDNIKDGFLEITVIKTKQKLSVPLTGIAYDILAKYDTMLKPLPVISNQKMNKYLKDLCEAAEILEPIEIIRFKGAKREMNVYPKHQLISVHTARKTFVTLSLGRGMKAEEIMAITGHSSYESFKRYLNVTKDASKTALLNAWGVRTLKVINGND